MWDINKLILPCPIGHSGKSTKLQYGCLGNLQKNKKPQERNKHEEWAIKEEGTPEWWLI